MLCHARSNSFIRPGVFRRLGFVCFYDHPHVPVWPNWVHAVLKSGRGDRLFGATEAVAVRGSLATVAVLQFRCARGRVCVTRICTRCAFAFITSTTRMNVAHTYPVP